MADMVQVPFGTVKISRIRPAGAAHQYKTYGAALPLATHWVPASCEEVDCEAHHYGWVTTLDLSTELGQRQYSYCTHDKSRSYTENRVGDSLVELTYPAGTTCFASGDHKRPLERPAVFYTRPGDWRGNPDGRPAQTMPVGEWTDRFATHLDQIRSAVEKG